MWLNILRHLLSILLLPSVVTILVPYLIVRSRLSDLNPVVNFTNLAAFLGGGILISLGLTLICATVWHFATVGRGTLAPWDPPRRLVVVGVYRHVRNPMISGVLLILFGEALALRSIALLTWAIAFFVINTTYIPLFEEQSLLRRFGEDYKTYCRNVRRWLPRIKPWEPPWQTDANLESSRSRNDR
jgi:protein-S-isoprenylcysteine O-methyltransferase Ste14